MASTKRAALQLSISAAIGSIVATATHLVVVAAFGGFNHSHMTLGFFVRTLLIYLLPVTMLAAFVGGFTYGILTKPKHDTECRCRRCGYILNGLTKLECPECGEKI